MRRRQFLGAAATVGGLPLLSNAAQAQKAEDTLRITWRTVIPDIDPYRNNMRAGLIASDEVWDMLVYRDPQTFKNVPALATEWKNVDDTTMEFTLREGVKFHNGDPFGADDVVYTINTIIADRVVSVPSNFSFWSGAEKINDHQVRLKMKAPFPAALE
ncbi:MAG: ABC transporter substrate-binding protein, partial [Acetobacteraceae bacterium]|nr:ABC transporter substrate-binding protein [Acetobacteraceae bacterium]